MSRIHDISISTLLLRVKYLLNGIRRIHEGLGTHAGPSEDLEVEIKTAEDELHNLTSVVTVEIIKNHLDACKR